LTRPRYRVSSRALAERYHHRTLNELFDNSDKLERRLAALSLDPKTGDIPLDAFFRFGFPFLSNVTLLFFDVFFSVDAALLVLLFPFIRLGLMTDGTAPPDERFAGSIVDMSIHTNERRLERRRVEGDLGAHGEGGREVCGE